MMMVFTIFGVVACAGVAKFAYDQATGSLFAREVARTYGEAFKIAFHAGKALTALPASSAYEYTTRSWEAPCKITITPRVVRIEREYQKKSIDVEVALPIPLTWRSTGCNGAVKIALGHCDVEVGDSVGGRLMYTDSLKFETSDVAVGMIEYQEYTCGDKLRFEKFKEDSRVGISTDGTLDKYEKLWVRKV